LPDEVEGFLVDMVDRVDSLWQTLVQGTVGGMQGKVWWVPYSGFIDHARSKVEK
jgi:hypothetical protein